MSSVLTFLLFMNNLLQKICASVVTCILVWNLSSGHLCAQTQRAATDEPRRSLVFAPTFKIHTVQDKVHSPLRYNGNSFGVVLGYEDVADARQSYLRAGFSTGSLFPTSDPGRSNASMQVYRAGISSGALWNIASDTVASNPLHIYLGAAIPLDAELRVHSLYSNSSVSWDIYLNLALAAAANYTFTVGDKRLYASIQARLPLVGFASRPLYITTFPVSSITQSLSDAYTPTLGVASILNYPMLSLRNAVHLELSNGNTMGLSYAWDFYNATIRNRVENARHSVAIVLQYRL